MGDGAVRVKSSLLMALDDDMFDLWAELGARTVNPLIRAGYMDAERFCDLNDSALLAIPGISRQSFLRIREWMKANDWVWNGVEGLCDGAQWQPDWPEWAAEQLRLRGWHVRPPITKN